MSDAPGILTAEKVLDVGSTLLELRPLDEVLETILRAAATAMNAETAAVILRSEAPDPQLVIAAAWRKGPRPLPTLDELSRSLLEAAISRRQPLLTESAVEDPRFANKSSIILQHIQAAVIVPLIGKHSVEGALYLDSRSDRDLFREDNLGALSTLATFAALALDNARRYDSTRRELEHLKGDGTDLCRGNLIGAAPPMQRLYAFMDRVAATDLAVLISGESGTGKELVAREIHRLSPRAAKPFMALYCGNVSSELFESEMFGHKAGAFTGAVTDKQGLVDAVRGGTLFLDEVADIPLPLQQKLLRFLQNSEFRAVGDTVVHCADVRILAATNKDLKTEIAENRFREDLFYRLNILPVQVPPLRDRPTDIPLLVRHLLSKGRRTIGGPTGIAPAALRYLMNQNWPGNVRELENVILRARVLARGNCIELEDVALPSASTVSPASSDLSWNAVERKHILEVLALCEGNKSRAAKVLGISRRYLYNRLEQWEQPGGERSVSSDSEADGE